MFCQQWISYFPRIDCFDKIIVLCKATVSVTYGIKTNWKSSHIISLLYYCYLGLLIYYFSQFWFELWPELLLAIKELAFRTTYYRVCIEMVIVTVILCGKSDYIQFRQLRFKKANISVFDFFFKKMFLFFVIYLKCQALVWPCNSMTFSLEMQSF